MKKPILISDFIPVAILFIFLFNSIKLFGQVSTDNAISSAMGETGTAFVNGFSSIGINPARLSIFETGDNRLTVSLFGLGLAANANGLNTKLYNELFGKETRKSITNTTFWTDSDKDKFLNAIEGDALRINSNARTTDFGISYHFSETIGTFGFTVRDHVGANGIVAKDYFDLALRGNVDKFLGKTIGSNENQFSAWWNREYALTYSREFKFFKKNPEQHFYGGASLKFVSGLQYAKGTADFSVFSTSDSIALKAKYEYQSASSGFFDNTDREFSLFPPSTGSGYGIDLGASVTYSRNLSFAISLNDLGWISYNQNTEKKTLDTIARFTGLYDPIKASDQLDSLRKSLDTPTRDRGSFSASLPTHLRVGAAMKLDDLFKFPATVTLDWIQGFNREYGNTTTPIIGIGTEFRPFPNYPIRSGFRFGGRDLIGWSLGLALEYQNFSLDLSTRDAVSIYTPTSSSRISFGLGVRVRLIDGTPAPPPPPPPPPTPPIVNTFRSSVATINRGDTTIIIWQVTGTDSVFISPVVGKTIASGSVKLRPQQTTTFTLSASNNGGTSKAQTVVTVNIPLPPPLPIIPPPTLTAPAVFTVPFVLNTKSYTLLFGSFSKLLKAEEFVVKYRIDGYKILINDTPLKGSGRYRVYAGSFKTLKEARATLKEFKKLLPRGTRTERMKAARTVKK